MSYLSVLLPERDHFNAFVDWCARVRREGRADGYAEGFDAGYAEGMQAGRRAAASANARRARVQRADRAALLHAATITGEG